MSKKKNQKIAYKFLRKKLKNPENIRAAFACYSDSSVAFTGLMRNIFGENKGNKIVDIILADPLPNKQSFDKINPVFGTLIKYLENERIESITFNALLTSPYTEVNDEFTINRDDLKDVKTFDTFMEIMYNKVSASLERTLKAANVQISDSKMPNFIRTGYTSLISRFYNISSNYSIHPDVEYVANMTASRINETISMLPSTCAHVSSISPSINVGRIIYGGRHSHYGITKLTMTYYTINGNKVDAENSFTLNSDLLPKYLIDKLVKPSEFNEDTDSSTSKKVTALHTDVILNLGDIIAYDAITINNEHIKRCTRLGRLAKSNMPDTVCITSTGHPEGIYFDAEMFKSKTALTAFAKDTVIFTQYQAFIDEDNDVDILSDSKIHGMIENIIQNPGDASLYTDFIIEIGKLYEIDTDSKNIYIIDESEYESDSSNITLIPIHYVDK